MPILSSLLHISQHPDQVQRTFPHLQPSFVHSIDQIRILIDRFDLQRPLLIRFTDFAIFTTIIPISLGMVGKDLKTRVEEVSFE